MDLLVQINARSISSDFNGERTGPVATMMAPEIAHPLTVQVQAKVLVAEWRIKFVSGACAE